MTFNKKTEVARCTTCGFTMVNHPQSGKGQSLFTLVGSEFTCTKCGWDSKLVLSPYYAWLYLF